MRARFRSTLLVVALVAAFTPTAAGGQAPDPARAGVFLPPFAEPTVGGVTTEDDCVERADGTKDCKPAAGSMALLPNGKVLYWNALEGTENIEFGIAAEFGRVAVNDQARVLEFLDNGNYRWVEPTPVDGGATNPGGEYLLPEALVDDPEYNDGSLFCTDLLFLPDGRLLITGGTDYYSEPGVAAAGYGVAELEGLKSTRIFDPATNSFTQSGDMHFGRWYPSMVTLGDGKVFLASGVTKLIKTMYADRPPTESGTNVHQTETFNPRTGTWAYNGPAADRSLPLYPRLHLLPNGEVFYNAGGQVFNPNGYSYDEALWNIAASYDPKDRTWTDLGVPGLGSSTAPGFRGSAFSAALIKRPDAGGRYTEASYLTAGGVLGASPGGYVAIAHSRVVTVSTASGAPVMTSEDTAPLNAPRWYGSAVTLPDGTVFAVSGADRDEVVAPGTGFPVTVPELFDPETGEWRQVAEQARPRTYHNSAMLLPDGRVLVGGHAPISTLYGNNTTIPGGFSPQEGRDPSFEIYEPPYLHYGVARPVIENVSGNTGHGQVVTVALGGSAAGVDSVVLMRNPSVTHTIDNDQHAVELPIVGRRGDTVQVRIPANRNVAPAGPYLLFVNAASPQGPVPSVAAAVTLG